MPLPGGEDRGRVTAHGVPGIRLLRPKRNVSWLACQMILRGTRILGKPSPCETNSPENLVSRLKLLHVSANRLHSSRDIAAEHIWCFGTASPAIKRMMTGLPRMTCQSSGFTDAAQTLIKT